MGAAVDDVHQRHRQGAGADAAQVTIERQAGLLGRGLGDREADPENGVGAELGLVGAAVELDHHAVDQALVLGVEPGEQVEQVVVDRLDRF